MKQQDETIKKINNSILTKVEDNDNIDNLLLDKFFKIFGLVILLVTIITVIGFSLIIFKGYSINHILCQDIILNFFVNGCSILTPNYLYLRTIGYLLLLNVGFLPVITRKKAKLCRYLLCLAATVFLAQSFRQLLIFTDFNLTEDKYLLETISMFVSIFIIFIDIFIQKNKLYDKMNLFCFIAVILSSIIY